MAGHPLADVIESHGYMLLPGTVAENNPKWWHLATMSCWIQNNTVVITSGTLLIRPQGIGILPDINTIVPIPIAYITPRLLIHPAALGLAPCPLGCRPHEHWYSRLVAFSGGSPDLHHIDRFTTAYQQAVSDSPELFCPHRATS
jgi:hypothetical protein